MLSSQIILLATVLSVILGTAIADPYPRTVVFEMGVVKPGDQLMKQYSLQWHQFESTQVAHVQTFTGDDVSIISRFVVMSITNNSVESVSLVAGGPGHTFITLRFEFTRKDDLLRYVIELYGKKVAA